MTVQDVSNLAGLISLGLILIVAIVGGIYMSKSNIDEKTSDAQTRAINAMQTEMNVLRSRIDDVRKENTRLEHVIDTICLALKEKGIIITISGEMINIEIDHKRTTTIRIDEGKE